MEDQEPKKTSKGLLELQASLQRPVMDQRRWYKEECRRRGLPYMGPEPEQFSPLTWQEEKRNLEDVLFGRREPRTNDERIYLQYMQGVQKEKGNKRWVVCRRCGLRFVSHGFAGRYPTICVSCADEADAKLKQDPRAPHNDP